MFDSFATIVLWLFVINLGIAFGAGLYEARIVVPQWLSPSPESGLSWNAELARQSNTGMRFWVYVTTVPLTLLTLASFIAAWWIPIDARNWWLCAAAAALVDRVMTFTYFNLGYVRHAATLAAWLCALKALSIRG